MKQQKTYRKVDEIRENFLSLSGTVYGYHSNNICYCRDNKKCTPTSICNDCDINRSGECPVAPSMTIPGVS